MNNPILFGIAPQIAKCAIMGLSFQRGNAILEEKRLVDFGSVVRVSFPNGNKRGHTMELCTTHNQGARERNFTWKSTPFSVLQLLVDTKKQFGINPPNL